MSQKSALSQNSRIFALGVTECKHPLEKKGKTLSKWPNNSSQEQNQGIRKRTIRRVQGYTQSSCAPVFQVISHGERHPNGHTSSLGGTLGGGGVFNSD